MRLARCCAVSDLRSCRCSRSWRPVPCPADADPALVEAGRRATAFVIAETDDGGGTGTAFCIDTAGIFVTNDHVAVPNGKRAKLTLVVAPGTKAERKLDASVVKTDSRLDVAILRVDKPGLLDTVDLAPPAAVAPAPRDHGRDGVGLSPRLEAGRRQPAAGSHRQHREDHVAAAGGGQRWPSSSSTGRSTPATPAGRSWTTAGTSSAWCSPSCWTPASSTWRCR